jgi:hypothetical protein
MSTHDYLYVTLHVILLFLRKSGGAAIGESLVTCLRVYACVREFVVISSR